MDRVEQFIREGMERVSTPETHFSRRLILSTVPWLFVVGLLFYLTATELYSEEYFEFYVAEMIIYAVICLVIFFTAAGKGIFQTLFGEETRFRAGVCKRFEEGSTSRDYATAAKVLRGFKTSSIEQAVAKYGEPMIDLLFLSGAIWYHDKQLRRMVSIKSIEEDRAAGPEDE